MFESDRKQLKQERKRRIKEGKALNAEKKPKEARLDSKVAFKEAKKNYRLANKNYKLHKGPQATARGLFFKQQRDRAKLEKQIATTLYKRAKKADDSYIPNRIKRRTKQSAKMKLRHDVEKTIRDNDILGDWVQARQNIRQFKYQVNASKRAAKVAGKLSKYTIKHSYGQLNKSYNFIRGRGYTRTPREFSWEGKLSKKMKHAKKRLARSKFGKASKRTGKVFKFASKLLRSILANPLAVKSFFLMFLIFAVIGVFMAVFGGSGPVQQNEFDLNKSWLQISKRDREKSNDKVDYWTNIDDMLFFMNFRYGSDWKPESSWKDGIGGEWAGTLGFNHYSDALNDLWNHLNDDPHNLKKMADLYGSSSKLEWAKLSDSELEEYKELEELTKEVGRYPSYQELANPFYLEDDPSYQAPLVILKRFGYTSKSEIYEKTQLKASTGQAVRAPIAGKVSVTDDTTVSIKTDKAIFTYEEVGNIRVSDGDQVNAGDEVGKVTSNGYQVIQYQKLEEKETKDKKEKWTSVNPGFYFQSVTYNQTTSVITTLDGDLGQKSRAIKDYLKQKVPGLTDNGLAAMLGNFATESNINPKRAEGDYLSPPVGADSSSWDDESWLAIGGPAIYNGRYPNILRRGLGLGQWTDTADGSTRHTLLLNYAKSKNKKWYDLELQLDFMLEGDTPYYITELTSILTSTENVETLTERFLVNWEGNSGDKVLERQNNAKQIHAFLTQQVRGGGALASSWNFPEEYQSKVEHPPTQASMTTQQGSGYEVGQCTWYAYNRLVELGTITDLSGAYGYLGNGQDWVASLVAKGWRYSTSPTKGAVVSVLGGFGGTPGEYGHVAIVEAVNPDGSFLVSECNIQGVQDKVHFRVIYPAYYYTFATPN